MKYVISGIVSVFVIISGCIFYYQWDIDQFKQEIDIRETNINDTPKEVTQVSVESITLTTEEPTNKSPSESVYTTSKPPANKSTDGTSITIDIEDIPKVSPHGFGSYPEIPHGAPVNPFTGYESIDMELLKRTIIKAWNNGERFEGASTDNQYGKIYLHYPNTLYIEYDNPTVDIDGNVRVSIMTTLGAGDVRLTPEQMKYGEIPNGVRVLSLRDDGIDPYAYLELP